MGEAMIQVLPVSPADLPLLERAQATYDIARSGGEARYHYFNGSYLQEQEEWAQARVAFKRARELDPEFPSVYYKLGELRERLGDPDGAEYFFDEALRRQPGMVSAALGKVRVLMQTRRQQEAGELIRRTQEAHPEHLAATLYLTRFLRSTGMMDAALKQFASSLPTFVDSAAFHWEYGQLLWQQRRETEAAPHLEFAAQDELFDRNQRAEAYLNLAQLKLSANDAVGALAYVEACRALVPMHLDALLLGAGLQLRQTEYQAAEQYLTALLSLPPAARFTDEDILAYLPQPEGGRLLADIYQVRNQTDAAKRVLELTLEILTQQDRTQEIPALQERIRQIP